MNYGICKALLSINTRALKVFQLSNDEKDLKIKHMYQRDFLEDLKLLTEISKNDFNVVHLNHFTRKLIYAIAYNVDHIKHFYYIHRQNDISNCIQYIFNDLHEILKQLKQNVVA